MTVIEAVEKKLAELVAIRGKHMSWGEEQSLAVISAAYLAEHGEEMPADFARVVKLYVNVGGTRQRLEKKGILAAPASRAKDKAIDDRFAGI